MRLTFADLTDHCLAYGGDDATVTATTKYRRAVQEAYNVIPSRHDWKHLWAIGRVTTNGGYATGTVTFDVTGGANERQLTLTGGTWPTWAADGYVIVNNVPYEVDARISGTIVTITAATAPPDDFTDQTFTILRDQYQLPSDFLAGDEVVVNDVGVVLDYMHPRTWVGQRRTASGPGQPLSHTFVGDAGDPGTLHMAVWPPPDAAYAIDFLYRRRLRPLVFERISNGSVSATAASSTVTGVNTTFRSAMVGSVIRLSSTNQEAPTGDGGANPAAFESIITAVASATSLTVRDALPETFDATAYVVSDPVDIERAILGEYLLREVEKQFRSIARSVVPKLNEDVTYQEALIRACEADNRTTARAASGRSQSRRSGFDHYPMTFN